MKHVLFVVLPERGHIHPFLGAAAELRRRGARVSFYAPRDVRAILAPYGFIDVHHPDGAAPPAAEHRGAAFTALLENPARLRAWIRAMLVDAAEPAIAPLRAHLRASQPTVVVIDPMAYFAAIAAHEEGLPWLGLSTSLNPCIADDTESELIATLRDLDDARHALFQLHGMQARFRVSDVLSPRGTFVLSTRELLGEHLPDDGVPVHLVGASLPDGDAQPSAAPELVYASFGSQAYHQPRRLRAVIDAARSTAARFVIAMGDLAATSFASDLPPNVEAVAFAPQVALMREASVVVTHGGANSVHEALAHGVPLLVSPICNDQLHNAELVARRGVGRVVDLATAPSHLVASSIGALLGAGAPERAAAADVARSYRRAGGSPRIADIVLEAAC